MKKLFIILIGLIILPLTVFAEGYISVSPSSLTIEQGSSKTITITAYNAIGDATISSSNSSVAAISTSSWETGAVGAGDTKYGSITVTGVSVGTATINLTIDGATFDLESVAGTRTVTVNVIEKTTTTTTTTKKTTKPAETKPTTAPTTTKTESKPTEKKPVSTTKPVETTKKTTTKKTTTKRNEENDDKDKLSDNNNLKELIIEGYELEKQDNNYILSVNNSVTEITISAEPEDKTAKIDGIGKKTLEIGENKFTITIESESGKKQEYTLTITRKDALYLEDLKDVLANDKTKEADFFINNDSVIDSDSIKLIKKNKSNIKFNYFNEENKLIYSWSINGKKIKDIYSLDTKLEFTSNNIEKIGKSSNYADGLYLNFKHKGDLPEGTKIKVFVGDKFKDKDIVNVYHFNSDKNKLNQVAKELKVRDGYIEFDIEHCSEYFVTMSLIKTDSVNVFMIISIIETLIIIGGIVILKKKKLIK